MTRTTARKPVYGKNRNIFGNLPAGTVFSARCEENLFWMPKRLADETDEQYRKRTGGIPVRECGAYLIARGERAGECPNAQHHGRASQTS